MASMSEPTIRKATPADIPVVAAYNISMAKVDTANSTCPYSCTYVKCAHKETEGLVLPDEIVHKGVEKVLTNQTSAVYYVIEKNSVIIAQLMITFEWSDWRATDIWWIQSVYVHPDHRKNGYFRMLYNYVKTEARNAGACGLRLYADVHNTRAHTAYENLGMTSHYKVYEDLFTSY